MKLENRHDSVVTVKIFPQGCQDDDDSIVAQEDIEAEHVQDFPIPAGNYYVEVYLTPEAQGHEPLIVPASFLNDVAPNQFLIFEFDQDKEELTLS